jgi:pimeloyl-ACP methyl ester carboxylesterase
MTQRHEHQAIRLADGRLLGFAEYGDPSGAPVLFFHGEVDSRLLGRAFEPSAHRLGLRVIAADRPGMGFSDFQAGRVVADWPADVTELTRELGIDGRFAVLGASGGAPYALACAWKMPERLTATVLAGPAVPVSMKRDEPGTSARTRVLRQSAVRAPWTIRVMMTLLGEMTRRSPEQLLGRMSDSAGDVDREVFTRADIRSMIPQSMAETFRSGPRGAAHDMRLLAADWGLPFNRIVGPVSIWHGEADRDVTPAEARELAAALPNCELHLLPGAAHHLALTQTDALLDAVVAAETRDFGARTPAGSA